MAGNIIPAIATTNAMTASLCVLQAFKVMRDDLAKAKMVFLAPNGTERRLTTEPLQAPNPSCPACSVAQSTVIVDPSRATLNDLVQDLLRLQLGYGEEFSVNSEAGILYDPEEDTNLNKTFKELGLVDDSFITVIDEEDEDTKVNLVLSISAKELKKDTKPIHLPEKLKIPPKPKPAAPTEAGGFVHATMHPTSNGVTNGLQNGDRKRTADQAGLEDELVRKKGKVAAKPDDDDVVIVDDPTDGAIVIDDD